MHQNRCSWFAKRRPGFTLNELLVVIAIITVLIGLLTPAVQSARESSNRVQCANNLRQMGLGMISHHTTYGRFPSGGWGWLWCGDPDRGTDYSQPGGWVFNLLPYVEQDNVRRMGAGLPPAQKKTTIGQRIATPLELFNCPSRRTGGPYPNVAHPASSPYYDSDTVPLVARGDYAANAGNQAADEFFGGPTSLAQGDDPNYAWPSTDQLTGIIFQRSAISIQDITRGTSNTYLLGEKYLNPDSYATGTDGADNENLYTGFDNDNYRSTDYPLLQDRKGYANTFSFGSAHRAGANMLNCDGSVHFIQYTVDPAVHFAAGSRY
jgi:prepilin-type N-terminal cleavage/methylation domain-containing protein